VTGGTVFSTDSPETYCAMANAGYDFIWTEMQHDSRDWGAVGRMWKACPHAKAVPASAWLIRMNAKSSTPWIWARW
jgi:2-keto-3-deoxy-L-rhamnonate aldolase RhmA